MVRRPGRDTEAHGRGAPPLGQLTDAKVSLWTGSVIVSTPQNVALIDTRKGVATFRKLGIPVRLVPVRAPTHFPAKKRQLILLSPTRDPTIQITGAVLNMSYFHVPETPASEKHYLFGPPTAFESACSALGLDVLAQIPIEPDVSTQGDRGTPVVLRGRSEPASAAHEFKRLAEKVWSRLQ